jgi:hypothetical protein
MAHVAACKFPGVPFRAGSGGKERGRDYPVQLLCRRLERVDDRVHNPVAGQGMGIRGRPSPGCRGFEPARNGYQRWNTIQRGRGCRPVESMVRLGLGLVPLPVAGVSVDRSSPGWLPQKASLRPLTHRHPPGPFRWMGRQSRTWYGGGERGHRGQPDDTYLAAASQRFQRIPLATRYFRDRRCSAPRLRQIVAWGQNPYPGFRRGPLVVVHAGSAQFSRYSCTSASSSPRLKTDLRPMAEINKPQA